ncbi:pathogenesis-related protein STH-21-like [Aristolochia californica]|uniref:pathogenesis-related protein STH-21-like n=1 Tax=Aristolochia californica TaxID=171875 RepID=UPI0035E2A112
MVAGSYSMVSVNPVSPARLWKASIDNRNLIPQLISDQNISFDRTTGSSNAALKDLKYVKNKVVAVDNENYVFKFSVVEGGGIGTKLKSCSFEIKLEATSEGGTKTTVKIDYDSHGDSPLSEEEAERFAGGVLGQTKAIEGHLQANPDAYSV